MTKPIQKILFGSPGTGKSHRISKKQQGGLLYDLGITIDSENHIATVFHPEYTYGDFMGKLMPLTVEEDKDSKIVSKVTYNYYAGHFLKALAQAYKNIIIAYLKDELKEKGSNSNDEISDLDDDAPLLEVSSQIQNVALVIDEINRGNSSAIFGTVFQLLDREIDEQQKKKFGWSSYSILVSEMEFRKLLNLTGIRPKTHTSTNEEDEDSVTTTKKSHEFKYRDENGKLVSKYKTLKKWLAILGIEKNQIKLPPNLHLFATMNTSDNSIYFMDNAFKRRWDWQFVNVEDDKDVNVLQSRSIKIEDETQTHKWVDFVYKLNQFIISHYKVIRKIEDKQVGYFFINEDTITEEHIKNKLMFFIWDSVFNNNKKPLVELLFTDSTMDKDTKNRIIADREKDLVTFGQFTQKEQVINFITKILSL